VTVSGGTGQTLALGRVADAAACRANGWYYDDPAAPTQIVACPDTCAAIAAAGSTGVQVLLGSETVVLR